LFLRALERFIAAIARIVERLAAAPAGASSECCRKKQAIYTPCKGGDAPRAEKEAPRQQWGMAHFLHGS